MNTSFTAEVLLRMIGRKSVTLAKKKTARNTHNLCVIMTANGFVDAKEEETVHVNALDISRCEKLVEDSRAVLSEGMLCEDIGYSYSWKAREQPPLTEDEVSIECPSDDHVPVVAVTKKKKGTPAQADAGGESLREWLLNGCGSVL